MTPDEVKRLAQEEKAKCEELEDLAFRGAELPKGLPFPQELLFLKFRYLYQYAKIAQMQPEQGRREKQEILNAYVIDKANDTLYRQCTKLWKNVEAAATAVRKDADLMQNEKVRALLTAVYGEDM